MAYDGLITSFLGQGLAASRPVAPNIDPDAIAFWYSTDNGQVAAWIGGSWVENVLAYSDEQAQDAIGTILTDSSTVNFTYDDATPSITASIVGALLAANNLSDLASPSTARDNLLIQAAEWAPNFTSDGDLYIPAVVAMTIDQGNAAIGTGTITFEKSTAAAPGTFSSTTLPATLEAGAWLHVNAASVTGFVATHLKRTA